MPAVTGFSIWKDTRPNNGGFKRIVFYYLDARLAQIDAKTVGIGTVVFNKLLKRSKRCATRNEEPALVELSDSVVFHRVTIAH